VSSFYFYFIQRSGNFFVYWWAIFMFAIGRTQMGKAQKKSWIEKPKIVFVD